MRKHPLTILLICALGFSLVACTAPSKETGFPKDISEPKEEEHEAGGPITGPIKVEDNVYSPVDGTVAVGAKVEWDQTGAAPHSVTSDDGLFDSHPDCLTDQKCMKGGDKFAFTFDTAGTYKYYCVIHGSKGGVGMAGSVTVE